jgi:hypothetical protein
MEGGEHQKAQHLQNLADRQHPRDAEARGEIPARQVRGNTGGFVKQEQKRKSEGRALAFAKRRQQA